MTTDAWAGIPLHPEQDGAHVLSWRGDDPEQAWWIAKDREWLFSGRDTCAAITAGNNARYLGPCLAPDEVVAREAAAAEAMLGKAVERLYEIAGRHDANGAKRDAAVVRGAARLVASLPIPAAAIRTLPLPTPDLDTIRAQARREGMEAAAVILEREAAHWREWSAGELARNAAAAIRARGKAPFARAP